MSISNAPWFGRPISGATKTKADAQTARDSILEHPRFAALQCLAETHRPTISHRRRSRSAAKAIRRPLGLGHANFRA